MNRTLLQSLRQQQTHSGTWLSLGSTVTAEIASQLGFDWLLFDLEHGLGTEAGLLSMLQAASPSKAALIVRVGHIDVNTIARALDWGADGIMLPQVETAEKAMACLDAMLYPPNGHRGFSGSARAYRYGLDVVRPANQPAPLFMAQVETWQGVQNAAAIAAVPGVDVLFIGPSDLKIDLAALPAAEGVTVDDCIDRIIEAASLHGRQTGIVVKNSEELNTYRDKGIHFISYGSDLLFVKEGWQQALKCFQETRVI